MKNNETKTSERIEPNLNLYMSFYTRSYASFAALPESATAVKSVPFDSILASDKAFAEFIQEKYKLRPEAHFEAPEFLNALRYVQEALKVTLATTFNQQEASCVQASLSVIQKMTLPNFKIYYDEAWYALIFGLRGIQKCQQFKFYQLKVAAKNSAIDATAKAQPQIQTLYYVADLLNDFLDKGVIKTLQFLVPVTEGDLAPIEFVNARPLPMYHVGVVSAPTKADNFEEPFLPLEFLAHDFQHAKSAASSDRDWMRGSRKNLGLLSDLPTGVTSTSGQDSWRFLDELVRKDPKTAITEDLVRGIMERRLRFKDVILTCLAYPNEFDPKLKEHAIDYLNDITHEAMAQSFGPDFLVRVDFSKEFDRSSHDLLNPSKTRILNEDAAIYDKYRSLVNNRLYFKPKLNWQKIDAASKVNPSTLLNAQDCFTDSNPFSPD